MKEVTIKYFAKLREERGVSEEKLETELSSFLDLYNSLLKEYHFSIKSKFIRVAVNEEFVDWNEKIKDNDTIAFILPVAGG